MRRFIMLAVACATPGALLAQAAAPAATSAAPAAVQEKPKQICRREEVTGSNLPAHVCHTKEEWAQIEKANADNAWQFNAARQNGHQLGGSSGN